jgi:hypothetical protein
VPFNQMPTTELDAGFDNMGNASQTICNPVTNAGCTGTDNCDLDNSGTYWVCYAAGTPVVPTCGDCSGQSATCAPGNTCILYPVTPIVAVAECVHYCCTDADCGGTPGSCNMAATTPPPPNNVGICSQ